MKTTKVEQVTHILSELLEAFPSLKLKGGKVWSDISKVLHTACEFVMGLKNEEGVLEIVVMLLGLLGKIIKPPYAAYYETKRRRQKFASWIATLENVKLLYEGEGVGGEGIPSLSVKKVDPRVEEICNAKFQSLIAGAERIQVIEEVRSTVER